MSSKWYLPLIITLVGTAATISALAAPIPTESVELWNKPDGTQGMTLSAEQIQGRADENHRHQHLDQRGP